MSEAEEGTPKGPQTKRRCEQATPESVKLAYSTPKSTCRSLNFMANDEGKCVKVRNVPHPFMKLSFISALEKARIKGEICPHLPKAITDCFDYDRASKCVNVKFVSKEIATEMCRKAGTHFLHNTLQLEVIDATRSSVSPIPYEWLYDEPTLHGEEMVESLSGELDRLLADPNNCHIEDTPEAVQPPGAATSAARILEVENDTEDVQSEEATASAAQTDQILPYPELGRPCNKVKVSNLPDDFDNTILLYELKKSLVKSGFCSRDEKPAVRCVLTDKNSATVEFVSIDAASEVCQLRSAEYEGCRLLLEQVMILPDPELAKPSNKVKVSNLPDDFDNTILLYELKKSLVKSGFCSRDEKPAVRCVLTDKNSATVEFVSIDAASEVCQLCSAEYEGCKLLLEPVMILPDHEVAKPSNKVKVSNLPDDFDNTILLYELNTSLVKSGFCSRDVKPAVRCVSTDKNSAIVEFSSIEAASEICLVNSSEYEGDPLTLQSVMSESLNSTFKNLNFEGTVTDEVSEKKYSCCVIARNLPSPFIMAEFKKFLVDRMADAFQLDDGDVIKDCFNYKPSSKSVIVQFSCPEEANLATLLEHVVYKSSQLTLEKFFKKDDLNNNDDTTDSDSGENVAPDGLISIESKEGSMIPMKLLVKYRDNFPKSGSHDAALEAIRVKLSLKKVCASVSQIRKRRRNLMEQHKRHLREGKQPHDEDGAQFQKLCSVAFGSAHPSTLELSSDSENEEPESEKRANDLVRFAGGASWTTNSTKALINLCIDNREQYDQPIRRSKFWREISVALADKRYYYEPEKCKNKMDALTAEYKDYCQTARRTGAEGPLILIPDGPTREIMTLMHELKWRAVDVNPQVQLGAGIHNLHMVAAPAEAQGGGRNRPTVLKRKVSHAERRTLAREEKAAAFKLLAEKFCSNKSSQL